MLLSFLQLWCIGNVRMDIKRDSDQEIPRLRRSVGLPASGRRVTHVLINKAPSKQLVRPPLVRRFTTTISKKNTVIANTSNRNTISRAIIQPKVTKNGVTNKASQKVLSTTTATARLRSPFIAALITVVYSLALPIIGTIIRPIKALLIPDASTTPSTLSIKQVEHTKTPRVAIIRIILAAQGPSS